jgi:tRNA A37 methylthiotransferase MiaB
MPGHLDGEIVRERARILREVGAELESAYSKGFLGQTLEVLWEKSQDEQGRQLGKTKNYLNIAASPSVDAVPGEVSQVVLRGYIAPQVFLATKPGLCGEIKGCGGHSDPGTEFHPM